MFFFSCKDLYRGTTEALGYCNDVFQCIKFTSENYELSVNRCFKRSWNDDDVRVHLYAVSLEITALWNRLKAASASREPVQPRRLLELRSQTEKLSFKRTSPILVAAVFKGLFLSSHPVNVPGHLITRHTATLEWVHFRVSKHGTRPGCKALRGCISR